MDHHDDRSIDHLINNGDIYEKKKEVVSFNGGIKDCRTIQDYIQFLLRQGEWEMYTYEWLLNRISFLYYNTIHGSYFFYLDNNELVLFNEESFYLYICTFEKTEFIRQLFFESTPKKKLKLKCFTKTMQGRRMKQEDRYITISDLSQYIDPTDYKTLYFYKRNPIHFYAICDGHRGIKACEYCQNNLIKNIILFFYGKKDEAGNLDASEKKENGEEEAEEKGKKYRGKRMDENENSRGDCKKRKTNDYITKDGNIEEIEIEKKKVVANKKEMDIMNDKQEVEKKEPINHPKQLEPSQPSQSSEPEIIKELDCISDEEIAKRIKLAFQKTDADFIRTSKFALHGCTVVSLIVFKNKIFVANLGDCRAIAVIKKNNLLTYEVLTRDHKPNHPKEKERIRMNGGDVVCFQNVYRVVARANKDNKKKCVTNGMSLNEQVYLSVSRAIGDKDFKYQEILSATPDVIFRDICLQTSDDESKHEKKQGHAKKNQKEETEMEKTETAEKKEKDKETDEQEKDLNEIEKTNELEEHTKQKENQHHNASEKKSIDLKDKDKEGESESESESVKEKGCVADREEKREDKENKENKNKNGDDTVQDLCYAAEELKYHFVFMACDGVWDILSNQHVVQIIQNYENDPDKACSEIIKTAYQKGSQDNLTAMLFQFF